MQAFTLSDSRHGIVRKYRLDVLGLSRQAEEAFRF